MKKFWKEFKEFISKGNVLDLAVAVIVGGAFNKIVSSLVNDVIMPLISLAIGGADVSEWKWVIREATETTAETALRYGAFIQAIIDFLIIALTIFVIIKIFNFSKNKLRKAGERLKEDIKESAKKLKKKKGEQVEVEIETEVQTLPEEKPAEVEIETVPEIVEKQDSDTELLKEIRNLLKENLNKKEE